MSDDGGRGMLGKFGIAAVGVTAGLLAFAPMASATEGHHGHEGGDGTRTCTETGGDANPTSTINGDAGLAGNVVSQLPVGGNVIANMSCSDIVTDNDDNFSHNDLGGGGES